MDPLTIRFHTAAPHPLLPLGELGAPWELLPVRSDDRIDDERAEGRRLGVLACKQRARLGDRVVELVTVVDARVDDVLLHEVGVEVEARRDRHEALGSEGALSVEVERPPLAATGLARQKGGHRHRERELRLARARLAIDLCDRARLEAAAQDLVELGAARGHLDARIVAARLQILGGLESEHGLDELERRVHQLVHLGVGQALDGRELPVRGHLQLLD